MKSINFRFLYKTKAGNIKKSDIIKWTCNCDAFLNQVDDQSLNDYLKRIPDMFNRYKNSFRGSYYGYEIVNTRGF